MHGPRCGPRSGPQSLDHSVPFDKTRSSSGWQHLEHHQGMDPLLLQILVTEHHGRVNKESGVMLRLYGCAVDARRSKACKKHLRSVYEVWRTWQPAFLCTSCLLTNIYSAKSKWNLGTSCFLRNSFECQQSLYSAACKADRWDSSLTSMLRAAAS